MSPVHAKYKANGQIKLIKKDNWTQDGPFTVHDRT